MEFRCVTQEERRPPAVESSALSEVLSLAQKLQAESEGLVHEEQVVEMGRELGVRPEYVRAAIRRHHHTVTPPRRLSPEPVPPPVDHQPVLAAAQALLTVFALLMLPLTARLLTFSGREGPIWILVAVAAAWVAGWAARQPRLAGIAGAAAVPMMLFVSSFYRELPHPGGIRGEAIFFSLFSLGPLCAAAGEAAGRARRRKEYLVDRERIAAPGR